MLQASYHSLELVGFLLRFGRQVDLLYVAGVVSPAVEQLCFALLLLLGSYSNFAVLFDDLLVGLGPQAHQIGRTSAVEHGSLLLPLASQVRDNFVHLVGELVEFLL